MPALRKAALAVTLLALSLLVAAVQAAAEALESDWANVVILDGDDDGPLAFVAPSLHDCFSRCDAQGYRFYSHLALSCLCACANSTRHARRASWARAGATSHVDACPALDVDVRARASKQRANAHTHTQALIWPVETTWWPALGAPRARAWVADMESRKDFAKVVVPSLGDLGVEVNNGGAWTLYWGLYRDDVAELNATATQQLCMVPGALEAFGDKQYLHASVRAARYTTGLASEFTPPSFLLPDEATAWAAERFAFPDRLWAVKQPGTWSGSGVQIRRARDVAHAATGALARAFI